jgi:hypothetical protein
MNNLIKKNFCKKSISDRFFSFLKFRKNKEADSEKAIRDELDEELKETDEEIKNKQNREELIKIFNSTYTEEQLAEINKKGEDVQLMEIKPHNYKYLLLAKRISLFFNIPLSIFLTYICETNISNFDEESGKKLATYYFLYFCDYLIFMNTLVVLHGLRNIVLLATYIPKEGVIEFKKLNLINQIKTKKVKIEDLKRMARSPMTPFKALRNKKTREDFSMFSIGNWNDIALFNTLFPKPKKVTKENIKNPKKTKH